MSSLAEDDEYIIAVKYAGCKEGSKDINFTLIFKGEKISKTYTIGSGFSAAEQGNMNDFVKISKSGNKFTITKINTF